MSEENKTEAEELTVKFAEDGKEHKVNDMPDEAKQLYMFVGKKKDESEMSLLSKPITI